MHVATLEDLELELWLRQRNNKTICWVTKEGKEISISEMTDKHLVNTINMLKKQKIEKEIVLENSCEI